EDDVFAVFRKLPESEGPAEHAHVGVDTHEYDIVDSALLEQVPDFDAGIADRVAVVDFEQIALALPRGPGIAAEGPELGGPCGMLFFFIILPAVVLIDRVAAFFFCGDPIAPIPDLGWQIIGRWRRDGALRHDGVLISVHAT